MNRLDIGKPSEVSDIKRDDLRNIVSFHDGYKSRIVHLYTSHRVNHNQVAPMLNHFVGVRDDRKEAFQAIEMAVRVFDAKAEPIGLRRPRAHVPELCKILESQTHRVITAMKVAERCSRQMTGGMAALNCAAEYWYFRKST